MSQSSPNTAGSVPQWLMIVASVVIALHLTAIVFRALAAPSGPWLGMTGPEPAMPPQFAQSFDRLFDPYLRAVKLTHNYHFPTNQPSVPKVSVEIRLRDEQGQVMTTVKFPEEGANFWVRHRQGLLAQGLGNDRMVMNPASEVIYPPERPEPEVAVLEPDPTEPRYYKLRNVRENLLPRSQMSIRPSDWQLLLVRSYARYACRTHGASRAEVFRIHKNPIPPGVLFNEDIQAGAFDEEVSNFGEFKR